MKKKWVKGVAGAYGDWLLLTKEIDDFGLAACESVLDDLILTTQNMTEFLKYQLPGGKSGMVNMYWIQFTCAGDTFTELDFFECCVKHTSLHKKISTYVSHVNQTVMEGDYPQELWQDEMHPRGSYAIVPLVLADAAFAPIFGRLFAKWDMEAETYQGDVVEMVIHRYGYADATLRLLALRNFSDGQATEENLLRILHSGDLKGKLDIDRFIELSIEEMIINPKLTDIIDITLAYFVQIYAGDDIALFNQVAKTFSQRLVDHPDVEIDCNEDGLVGDLAEGFEIHDWFGNASVMANFPPREWNTDLRDICIHEYLANPENIKDLC